MNYKYLASDPNIAQGELTIKGTRITISTVFRKLAAGMTIEYMLEGWPWLSEKTLRGAIEEAISRLELPPNDIPAHA
jgi:uncharacterized protein (DUF433 family)